MMQLKKDLKMETFDQLDVAIRNKVPLIWNDPDPIEGNDYTITWIDTEDLTGLDKHDPILIQYGGGSEAQVFLHEILVK